MRSLAIALVLAAAAGAPAPAVQPRSWTATATDLQNSSADGVAVTSAGRLFRAPKLIRLGEPDAAVGAGQVWAAVADSRGNVFLATGPDGRVVKLTPGGRFSVFFTCAEPLVTALALLPGGDLLAGTAPGGKIYRIRPDGRGEVWCETGERYVWTLVALGNGSVLAGTGEQGVLLRIGSSGEAERLFDAAESHVRVLAARPDGAVLAGGAGRGALYRIDPGGASSVLFDSDLAEVAAFVVEPDGAVVAALVASQEVEPRPPALRIQLPSSAQVGATPQRVADVDERAAPTLEGVIEGLTEPSDVRVSRRARGRIVRVARDGTVTELWRSSSETPLCLARDAEGRIVFGTGEPARIYRVEGEGETALLATLREGQATVLVSSGDSLLAMTSNPAAAYRIGRSDAQTGTLVSRPFDAQAPARWGIFRWRGETGAAGGVELEARSGNSSEPDSSWSAWGPAVTSSGRPALGVPDARFVQWRLRLVGESAARTRVSDVSVTYSPYNRPPDLEDFRLDGTTAAVSTAATFRWTASDPDGDPVAVALSYRPRGDGPWQIAVDSDPATESTGPETSGAPKDGKAVWATAELPEGEYEVSAAASDDGANPPGEGRHATASAPVFLVVDRTAPEILARRAADGAVEVVAQDLASPIGRVEILDGDRVAFSPRAEDGVCDSREESFRIDAAMLAGGAVRRVRATDAAGNVATKEMPPR